MEIIIVVTFSSLFLMKQEYIGNTLGLEMELSVYVLDLLLRGISYSQKALTTSLVIVSLQLPRKAGKHGIASRSSITN